MQTIISLIKSTISYAGRYKISCFSSLKPTHQLKVIATLVIVCMGVMQTNLSASPLTATSLPNIDLLRTSVQGSGSRGFGVLDSSIFVFAQYNDSGSKEVVAYNRATFEKEVLFIEPMKPRIEEQSSFDEVYSDGTVAFIVVDGNLYFTRGSKATTRLLGQFGVYNTKDGTINAILGGRVFDGTFYFIYSEERRTSGIFGDFAVNPALWRTTGGSGEFDRVSNSAPLYEVRTSFVQAGFDRDAVFFFKNETELWRTTDSNNAIRVGSLSSNQEVPRDLSVVRNSKGGFFCTLDEMNADDDIGALWRVSNGGTLTKVRNDCAVGSLKEFDDRIYFKTPDGIKSTDGIVGASQAVLTTEIVYHPISELNGFCEVDNQLFTTVTTPETVSLLRLSANGTFITVMERTRSDQSKAGISTCSSKNFLYIESPINQLGTLENNPRHWLFDPATESLTKIRSTELLIESPSVLSLRQGVASQLEQFCTTLFCLVDLFDASLPAMILLLMDED